MTWFKVDDGFSDHPKVHALQEQSKQWKGALALWLLAGSWAAKHEKDGLVPMATVRRLGFSISEADALVECGLWHSAEGGYLFHQWQERNPLKTELEAKREQTRNKVTQWRENKKKLSCNPVTPPSVTGYKEDGNQSVTLPPTRPVPTRPDPSRSDPPNPPGGGDDPPADPPGVPDLPISGAHSQSFDFALGEAAEAMSWKPAPRIGHAMRGQIIQRCREYAADSGKDFLTACREIAQEGLVLARATHKSPASALLEVEPGKGPPRRFGGGGRPERARATTGADFADAPSIEEQIKRMGGVT